MYWYLGLETFTWNMIEMFTYDTILARGNIYLEYNTCLQVEMFG